jgi:hypothetical protein
LTVPSPSRSFDPNAVAAHQRSAELSRELFVLITAQESIATDAAILSTAQSIRLKAAAI